MVNESIRRQLSYTLEDVLTEKQVQYVVSEWLKERTIEGSWRLLRCEVRPASEGLAGFLGDHIRTTLVVMIEETVHRIKLFMKVLPKDNKPKADFINESNFYRREMVMYKLFEEIGGSDGSEPWHPKAYIYNESILVMPDLAKEGYVQRSHLETFDLDHMLLVAASMARFHAAVANFETDKIVDGTPYSIQKEYGDIISECNFKDSPWLRAGAKLTANFLEKFSSKYSSIKGLEAKLAERYIEVCDSLTEYDNTLNLLIHKDLWVNNIMFRYEDSKPKSALLIDFQCLRYAPPAFDMMIFLYLNSTVEFRDQHELTLYKHYFDTFEASVDENVKLKLAKLGYDFEEFLKWCEKARAFGILLAFSIFPYVLMAPDVALTEFDDPETYEEYTNVDRTRPVLAHAYESPVFKQRILELYEEFVDRYLVE